LIAVASEKPIVLWIDDAHWADPQSLDLIRGLESGSLARPVLIVLTSRARLQEVFGEEGPIE